MKRRHLIQQTAAAGTLIGIGGLGLQSFSSSSKKNYHFTHKRCA